MTRVIVEVELPIKLSPQAHGTSSNWRTVAARAKKQLHDTHLGLLATGSRAKVTFPCVVEITRIGPRALDDDNVQHAAKHVRDAVAMWLFGGKPGARDRDPRVSFRYAQIVGPPAAVLVRVLTGS